MQSTTNYGLNKPEGADIYNIDDFNTNADIVDAELKKSADHIANVDNPHNVNKSQLGLGEVDNTSDVDKPVSTAQQAAINNAKSNAIATAQTNTVAELVTPWSMRTWKKGELASNSGKVYRALQDNTGPYPWDLGAYWEEVTTSDVIYEHQKKLDVIGGMTTVNYSVQVPKSTAATISSVTLEKGVYEVICSTGFDPSTGNSNGTFRRVKLSKTADDVSIAVENIATYPPIPYAATCTHLCCVMNVENTTTYYLNGMHDGDGEIRMFGLIRAVRIA